MRFRSALATRRARGGAVLAAVLLAGFSAGAHPYASGISNQTGTVSFILNESADSVQVAFDNRTVTNNLGALAAGGHSFALGAHTNFAIIVGKSGVGIPVQISADTNYFGTFYGPRGVAVNQNARTANFGRVYVVNANPGLQSNYLNGVSVARTVGQGVYLLNSDQSDAVGQGDAALTAGLSVDTTVTGTYVPYKVSVGPDDQVYLGDIRSRAGTSQVYPGDGAGVWMANPDFSSGQDLFPWASTTVFGGIISTPCVTGSLEKGDLTLYAVEWDLAPAQTVWKYNIGSGPLPFPETPTALCNAGISSVNGVGADMALSPDGKLLYTMEYRGTPGPPSGSGTPMFIFDANNNYAQVWASYATLGSLDPFAYCYGIAISPDGKYLATMNSSLGQVEVMKLTNGIPDLSTFTCVGAGLVASSRGIAFDAANNIYVTSAGSGLLKVYSLGQTTTCITANDATGTNGTFSFTSSDVSNLAFVTSATDPALDLQGNLVAAEYYGGQYGVLWIAGVPFVQNNTRVGGNASATLSPLPNFGATQDGTNLAMISQSDNWQASFDFSVPCTAGHSYKLQLLFHDNYSGTASARKRMFNVTAGGVPLANALDLAVLGANLGNARDILLAYSFTSADGSPLPIQLGKVADNPMISALTLEDTTPGAIIAPIVTANPQSQTVYAGAPAVFDAAALGTAVSYQWQAGPVGTGTYTNLANGGRFSGVTTPKLTITGTKSTDQLDYVVRVSNTAQTVYSTPGTLTVKPLGGVANVTAPADLGLNVGSLVAAEYFGPDQGPLPIAGVVFRNNNARIPNSNPSAVHYLPDFGPGADAANLALISAADLYAVGLDFTVPTVAGRSYLLKLLLHDNWYDTVGTRVFQVNAGLQSSGLGQVGPDIDLVQLGAYRSQPSDLLLTLGVTNSDGSPIEVQMNSLVENPMISALILQDVSGGTVPPLLTLEPQSVTLYQGHTTNLFAVVGGSSLVYQWQVSAQGTGQFADLADSAGNISGSATASLTLANVTLANAADYRLIAHNTSGSVTSAVASVTVLSGPPAITTGSDLPAAQFARVGQTVRLPVTVEGNAPFTFQWQASSDAGATWTTVVNGGRISGADTSVLTLANAQTNDSAVYRLSILNDQSGGTPTVSTADAVSILNGAATFNTDGIGWALNGTTPAISGNVFVLTTYGDTGVTRSAFYGAPVYVGAFQAGFTYQNASGPLGGNSADGATFVLQNDASGAAYLGGGGGGLGYVGPAGPSFALCFDLYAYDSLARGAPGYTYSTNGAAPQAGINPFRSTSPVSLVNTLPIDVGLRYFNGRLTLTLTDTAGASFTNVVESLDLPGLLGTNTAFAGFTGSDGSLTADQQVSNFYFQPLVTLASHTTATNTVVLNWEKNSGFMLQSTADLGSGAWDLVPAGTVAGEAVVPVSPAGKFYRLFSPLP